MNINIELVSTPEVIEKENFTTNDARGLCGVYVMYDVSDVCLYVGKTKDLRARNNQHASNSEFFPYVIYIEFYANHNEFEKDILETFLINELKPLYNTAKTYYLQEDLEEKLSELEEEEHIVRAEIEGLEGDSAFLCKTFLSEEEDDYELDSIKYEEAIDEVELDLLKYRLRQIHKHKYRVATQMSL